MAKETKEKNSFVLYFDYKQHLALLKDDERGRLFMALFDYAENGKEPDLDGAAFMAFSFIKAQIDRDTAKYEAICKKRREAGKRGGRPEKAEESNEKQSEAKETNTNTENQNEAKKANGYSKKQSEAKKPDNDTDNENDNDTDNENDNDTDNENDIKPYGLILLPPKGGIAPEAPEEAGKAAEPTPYKKIVALYHEICVSYPELKYISKKRKELMDARWKEYEQNLDTFRELFEQAENSQYLKGKNKNGWSASFDWLLAEENMPKVLEGNFADKPKSTNSNRSYDVNDFMQAALRRAENEREAARQMEEKKKNPPPTAADDPEIRERMEALQQKLG